MKIYDMSIIFNQNDENGDPKIMNLLVKEELLNKFNEINKLEDLKEKDEKFVELLSKIYDYQGNSYEFQPDSIIGFSFDNPREIKDE